MTEKPKEEAQTISLIEKLEITEAINYLKSKLVEVDEKLANISQEIAKRAKAAPPESQALSTPIPPKNNVSIGIGKNTNTTENQDTLPQNSLMPQAANNTIDNEKIYGIEEEQKEVEKNTEEPEKPNQELKIENETKNQDTLPQNNLTPQAANNTIDNEKIYGIEEEQKEVEKNTEEPEKPNQELKTTDEKAESKSMGSGQSLLENLEKSIESEERKESPNQDKIGSKLFKMDFLNKIRKTSLKGPKQPFEDI